MRKCQSMQTNEVSDFICTLPKGHAGYCDYMDAMGMCGLSDDCRAVRDRWAKAFPYAREDNPRPHEGH